MINKVIYREVKKFAETIKNGHRIIGLDVGEKKIGIAFSDTTHLIASAHCVYKRRSNSKDLEFLSEIIVNNSALAAVVGLPLNFHNGQENEWCYTITKFALKISDKMSKIFGNYPIFMQDERFSTIIANNILKKMNVSRKKICNLDDKIAAANILQQTLDRIRAISQ